MRRIYLDYNASTPIDPAVAAAMRPFLEGHFGNPSSGHWAAAGAKAALEEARGQVADLLGARSDEIIFTSGGSEANNLALKGVAGALKGKGNHIITSAVEHPAIAGPCRFLEHQGFEVSIVPVDRFGRIAPDDVARAITPRTILISMMHANNEVGTVQPIAEVSRIAGAHSILLHTDAAQSVGKIATDVNALGVDLLTVAGHKVYAPKGVGALCLRSRTPLEPLIHGAGHEGGRRAGTESALLAVGLGTACALVRDLAPPTPAIAQDLPAIRWRLTSGFPNSLDTIYGGAIVMAEALAAITGGKFRIQVFQAGELLPGPQAIDAVQANTVEIAHTCGYYFTGKNPTFAIGATIPFGLNSRQQNAWLYHGGGNELYNEFLADYGVIGIPGGNTGAQMGGWFRKEIKSLADLSGVKMRIAGLAGEVMSRLGVVPQQIPGGDIYPALERGTIDATEWVGPYDDEKLGFYQIARYYYPAYWEGGLTIHFFVNKGQYEALPAAYKSALDAACKAANINMQALYDVKNVTAIRSLVGKGVQLRPLPRDVMDAAYKAAFELYDELTKRNRAWAKIYPQWKKYRDESFEWFRVAEYTYDSYNYAAQARK